MMRQERDFHARYAPRVQITHQLRILRDAGLVEDVRDGQWIIYHISENVRATIAPLLGLFRETGRAAGGSSNDTKKLMACLKEGIRRKNSSGRDPERGRQAKNPE
jgi:DNA-binding transcriptional ArsR family regulator